jgi:RNA ligase (TIGR02306 family)
MSSLIVQVCKVNEVKKHPGADKLCLCLVKGWTVAASRNPETGKNEFEEGDLCVYIPPDSIIPFELSEKLNCTKYLSKQRVKVARLRSEPSYGLIMSVPADKNWHEGMDVAEELGIIKWEPPLECQDGDAEKPHPAFHKYTDIENYKNFPNLIQDNEEVVFTEKIHGKNSRIGIVWTNDENGNKTSAFAAGSHAVQRKEHGIKIKKFTNPETGEEFTKEFIKKSQFWEVFDKYPNTKNLLEELAVENNQQNNVIIFGEIYGASIQDLTYGLTTDWQFRAFDISVNGKYLDHEIKQEILNKHNIETVPILYKGPFNKEKIEEYVTGPTTICSVDKIKTKFKGREGLVITPIKERMTITPEKVFDRVILKAISFEYLERKGGTEDR